MTLDRENRRARGARLKQERMDRQGRVSRRFPWLMPTIVVLAVVIVVVGIVLAASLGRLF